MNPFGMLHRMRQLTWGCAGFYALCHVLFIVVIGGKVGVMLAYLLLFQVARNAGRFYRIGTTWIDVQSVQFPPATAYFLCAPKLPGRPVVWPGLVGALWLFLGGLIGWAAGGPTPTDSLVQYGHILVATCLAGGVLGATYGALVGRFEVYALQGRRGPTGAFRANVHAMVFVMMFFIQMSFVHPDLKVFGGGSFGTAWNAQSEGASHSILRGAKVTDGILAINFGDNPGKILFSQLVSATIAQPFAGLRLTYRWQGETAPEVRVALTGALGPRRNPTDAGIVERLLLAPLNAVEGPDVWDEAFVRLDRSRFPHLLLTAITVDKAGQGDRGALQIREIRWVRTKDRIPLSAPTAQKRPTLAPSASTRSQQVQSVGKDSGTAKTPGAPTTARDSRGVRGWLVPCLILVWGLGYLSGLLSVKSKRRSGDAFRNADLYALLTNAMLVLALVGILSGRTMGRPNLVGTVLVICIAFAGGNSLAYWRQRLKEVGPIV